MAKEQRCQSCGMPLGETSFGTNSDGTLNQEYCTSCHTSGRFTEPDLTVTAMIERSIAHMRKKLNFSEEKADVLAHAVIPQLKRWRRPSA